NRGRERRHIRSGAGQAGSGFSARGATSSASSPTFATIPGQRVLPSKHGHSSKSMMGGYRNPRANRKRAKRQQDPRLVIRFTFRAETLMSNDSQQIVSKAWNFAHVL